MIQTGLRIKLLLAFFLLFSLAILLRLLDLQVIRAGQLQNLAKSQHQTSYKVPARRGSILSSDGFPLAASSDAWLVWASLKDLEDSAEAVSEKLAPILAEEPVELEALRVEDSQELETTPSAQPEVDYIEQEQERLLKLLTKDASWVALKDRVEGQKKERIEKLGIRGIGFDVSERRIYPEASMSAHLLGFVGKDSAGEDKGYFGLEGYYDLGLSGVSGEVSREKDAAGLPILVGFLRRIKPLDGMNLVTHIDRTIQFTLEEKLKEGIDRYGAKSGTAVVMRPQDGAVLAMASLPAYEPARFAKFPKESFPNPAVAESFEPGSVFKVLVMAAALDTNVVEPETRCEACTGPRRIAEYTLRTWDGKYFPESTMTEVIQHSDNVGMVWVAEKLGIDKLYDYLIKFGIGSLTGIDLQEEATPQLRPREDWKFIDLAVAGFGQGVAVTPIQLTRAVAAIANGGVLPVPQVVDKINADSWEKDIKPAYEGRVISEETSREMTQMMVNAVEYGEAKWTKLRGFPIAGKTGTAQIPVAGHYDEKKTIASFIGFAPAQNPKFVMLVTLREPESSPWASETAAPLWFSIANSLFPYLGIHPE